MRSPPTEFSHLDEFTNLYLRHRADHLQRLYFAEACALVLLSSTALRLSNPIGLADTFYLYYFYREISP